MDIFKINSFDKILFLNNLVNILGKYSRFITYKNFHNDKYIKGQLQTYYLMNNEKNIETIVNEKSRDLITCLSNFDKISSKNDLKNIINDIYNIFYLSDINLLKKLYNDFSIYFPEDPEDSYINKFI